jgi:hypothetical protein
MARSLHASLRAMDRRSFLPGVPPDLRETPRARGDSGSVSLLSRRPRHRRSHQRCHRTSPTSRTGPPVRFRGERGAGQGLPIEKERAGGRRPWRTAGDGPASEHPAHRCRRVVRVEPHAVRPAEAPTGIPVSVSTPSGDRGNLWGLQRTVRWLDPISTARSPASGDPPASGGLECDGSRLPRGVMLGVLSQPPPSANR